MEALLKTFDLGPLDVPMIAVGGVLFFCLYLAMKNSVWIPFLKLIEAREAAIEGAKVSAAADLKAVAELQRVVEEKIHEVRILANVEKQRQIETAKRQVSTIVADAEAEAGKIIDTDRAEIARQISELKSEIEARTDELVSTVVEKLKSTGGEENRTY